MNDTPEEIAKFWKFLKSKIYQIKEKNLQLAIRDDGHMVGSVSGGCVEGDVVANALELFDDPKVKIIDYGITNDTAWEVGLACGGDIRIRIEIIYEF